MFTTSKAADLNQLVHGGQLYCAFIFSKGSLSNEQLFFRIGDGRESFLKGKDLVRLTSWY
jgi:hypothetical protein